VEEERYDAGRGGRYEGPLGRLAPQRRPQIIDIAAHAVRVGDCDGTVARGSLPARSSRIPKDAFSHIGEADEVLIDERVAQPSESGQAVLDVGRVARLRHFSVVDDVQARGTVVNIGAVSAHLTPPFYGPIAASKAALASFNDAMRQEFAPLGVKVFLIEPGAMKTGIFVASRATRDAWLTQRPDVERRYRPALAAMERAFERSGADDPEVVVRAVMAALSGRRAKPRAVVGKGAGAFVMMSRLPVRLRDRLVRSALGLSEALRPAN
jgi:NAD(P)-dependent dehydrogenase (short-subunit alcohol dehydrogenase family)